MTNNKSLPAGFRFSGTKAGIKASGKLDLALIAGDPGQVLTAAGVYTENLVRAASIDWNRAITPSGRVSALVINAGNANACTGAAGTDNNEEMANQVAIRLKAAANQVLVLSTGIIGVHLPMPKVIAGIDKCIESLSENNDAFNDAATAILTTDKATKTIHTNDTIGERSFALAGMCKGAGMIGPRMATLLGTLVTDLALTPEQAQSAIKQAVDQSFNRISVDGHMSTNDAIILLSSGKVPGPIDDNEFASFVSSLTNCCIELAKMIPDDGEGSSHLITVEINGANSDSDAEKIARTIAASNLVKTAITGADPNWGRIVSAAGYAGAEIAVEEMSLCLNGHPVFQSGHPVDFDENIVSDSMSAEREILISLIVGKGPGTATHWTSDLTAEYVRINSEYRT